MNESDARTSRGAPDIWNEDGEQFIVILNGELFDTFDNEHAAFSCYRRHMCIRCRTDTHSTPVVQHCDIYTRIRS